MCTTTTTITTAPASVSVSVRVTRHNTRRTNSCTLWSFRYSHYTIRSVRHTKQRVANTQLRHVCDSPCTVFDTTSRQTIIFLLFYEFLQSNWNSRRFANRFAKLSEHGVWTFSSLQLFGFFLLCSLPLLFVSPNCCKFRIAYGRLISSEWRRHLGFWWCYCLMCISRASQFSGRGYFRTIFSASVMCRRRWRSLMGIAYIVFVWYMYYRQHWKHLYGFAFTSTNKRLQSD